MLIVQVQFFCFLNILIVNLQFFFRIHILFLPQFVYFAIYSFIILFVLLLNVSLISLRFTLLLMTLLPQTSSIFCPFIIHIFFFITYLLINHIIRFHIKYSMKVWINIYLLFLYWSTYWFLELYWFICYWT